MTIPYTLTEEGALILWPEDVADLVFGPGLTLELAAAAEAMVSAAMAERRRVLDAEEAAAKTTDLGEYRKRRANGTRRAHRRTS